MNYDTVMIIGRPNVGKSTVFNKLAAGRKAIACNVSGMTRDIKDFYVSVDDFYVRIRDTAGFDDSDTIMSDAMRKTIEATKSADIILFITDGREGLTPDDEAIVNILRKSECVNKVVPVVNKTENMRVVMIEEHEIIKTGLGEPIYIAAETGLGIRKISSVIADRAVFRAQSLPKEDMRIAFVGRPNVGKSTLINRIIGEDRLLVADIPGITRDTIDLTLQYKNYNITLADTAGLRRRARIEALPERLSTAGTLNAVNLADVTVLMLDALRGLERQDCIIAENIINRGSGLILLVNKWDLVNDKEAYLKQLRYVCKRRFNKVTNLKIVTLSALCDKNCCKIIDAALDIHAAFSKHIPTRELNKWLLEAVQRHPPAMIGAGRVINFKFISQVAVAPPMFVVSVNYPHDIDPSYVKYLSKSLAEKFNFDGGYVRFKFRKANNPYAVVD